MTSPPTGPDGSPPPRPTPPGEQGYSIPTGSPASAGTPATPDPGVPYQAPQQHVPPPVYARGSAAVPDPSQPAGPAASGYPPGAGYPQPNPTVPPADDRAPGGHPQPGYTPAEGQASPAGPTSTPPFGGPLSGSPVGNLAAGTPLPGQPAYPADPISGPPFGSPPMSGPPFGSSPMSGPPFGAPPSAARRRANAVLVLAIVAGLLFALSGVMTGLFVAKAGELTDTKREFTGQVADRDTTIAANNSEIERLKRDLEAANDKIADIEQDLTGTKNDRDELARQKQVISNCLNLLGEAGAAANAGDRAAYEKAMKKAGPVCDEADKYL